MKNAQGDTFQVKTIHNGRLKCLAGGFTLIEVMVTVAIIGIIMTIAIPSYTASQLRAGRAEAKSILLEVASNQERFYSINNSYSTDASPLTGDANIDSLTGKYEVGVAACSTGTIVSCFVATATPQGSQADDGCSNMTISNVGVRGSSSGVAADCWQR